MDRGPSSPGALRPGKNLLHDRVGTRWSLMGGRGLRSESRGGGGRGGAWHVGRYAHLEATRVGDEYALPGIGYLGPYPKAGRDEDRQRQQGAPRAQEPAAAAQATYADLHPGPLPCGRDLGNGSLEEVLEPGVLLP